MFSEDMVEGNVPELRHGMDPEGADLWWKFKGVQRVIKNIIISEYITMIVYLVKKSNKVELISRNFSNVLAIICISLLPPNLTVHIPIETPNSSSFTWHAFSKW